MLQDSSQTEFLVMYSRLKLPVYNYVQKMLRDRPQAEDIVQNTFLKLFEQLNLIRNRESIPQWVYRTARNYIYQYFRTKNIHIDRFNVDDVDEIAETADENPELALEMQNIKEIIARELEKLPIEQKEVFLLREYGGLSYREITEVLGADEGLVRSRLHAARAKMVSRLKKIIH